MRLQTWILKFFCFLLGCWLTYFLQSKFKLSAVLSASLVGFLGTLIPENSRIDRVHVQATIYTGTFVAMGSRIDLTSPTQLFLVSLVGTFLYLALDRHFKGLGGKMGLVALVSTLLSLMLRSLT